MRIFIVLLLLTVCSFGAIKTTQFTTNTAANAISVLSLATTNDIQVATNNLDASKLYGTVPLAVLPQTITISGGFTNGGDMQISGTNRVTKLRVGGAGEAAQVINVLGGVLVSGETKSSSVYTTGVNRSDSGFSTGTGGAVKMTAAGNDDGIAISIFNGSTYVGRAFLGTNAVFSGFLTATNGIYSGTNSVQLTDSSGIIRQAALPLRKMKIFGGLANVTIATGASYCSYNSTLSVAPSASTRAFNSILPIGGYFTNLEVYSYATWLPTTNVVFAIGTNSGQSGIVGTALTCTLSPNGSNVYTNSGTASYTLPSSRSATGDVIGMILSTTSPGGNLLNQYLTWSLDYYYPQN